MYTIQFSVLSSSTASLPLYVDVNSGAWGNNWPRSSGGFRADNSPNGLLGGSSRTPKNSHWPGLVEICMKVVIADPPRQPVPRSRNFPLLAREERLSLICGVEDTQEQPLAKAGFMEIIFLNFCVIERCSFYVGVLNCTL